MSNNIWQLQDAKSKFSELINRTLDQGTQIVTRHGKKTVVILRIEDFERLTKHDVPLSRFLLNSPLIGMDLTIIRDKTPARIVEIEP